MGNFSYICPACRKNIRYGEVAHLRHIRHGEVLGETVGRYDGYGGVSGDFSPAPNDIHYRQKTGGYINCHDEIWRSEFRLEDSKNYRAKIYKGKPYCWEELRREFGYIPLYVTPPDSFYELWDSLEKYVPKKIASGTSAYHEACYRKLSEKQINKHVISRDDPRQGCGMPRDEYYHLETVAS